jgi:hypothetical protein
MDERTLNSNNNADHEEGQQPALAFRLLPGPPKAPAGGARGAGDRLGALPGGAPAPLGAFWGEGGPGRGGVTSALIISVVSRE